MLSVILPSRNERFLQQTIDDVLLRAKGDVEVIAVLDGYWPDPPLKDDKRVKIIHRGVSYGMRAGINAGVAVAQGKYIMKFDAHCMMDEGFDLKLIQESQPNLIQIPRRKRLDAEKWCIQEVKKPDIDAMYLSFPDDPEDFGGPGLNGKVWEQRARERIDVLIDDEMSFQGSGWFMEKDYFYQLELMDEENYGPFWNEAQEIGLKCWLSGGRVVRNKKTWYAHLHKGKKYGRGYHLNNQHLEKGAVFTKNWIHFQQAWDKQTVPLQDLIKRFWPIHGWTKKGYEKLFKESF